MDEMWESIATRVGNDLRVAMRYEATGFEARTRDDVRGTYSAEEDRAAVDDTIVAQLRLAETERTFETGSIRAVVRVFDDAWTISRPDALGAKSGLFVSIQRDGGAATMSDAARCIEYVDGEAAPRLERGRRRHFPSISISAKSEPPQLGQAGPPTILSSPLSARKPG